MVLQLTAAVLCARACLAAGSLGDALQRLAAQRTGALKPSHQWVPWVSVRH